MANSADRLLLRTTRHSAARMVLLGLLTLVSSATALVLPAVLGRAVDLLLAGGAGAGRWTVTCAALIAVQLAVSAVSTVLTATTDAGATAWLRGALLRHLLAIGPEAGRRHPPGDVVTRVTGNAAHAGTAPAALAAAAAAVLTPLGGIVALAVIDWRLAAAFLAGMPLLALLLRAFVRSTADSVTRYQRLQGDIAGRLGEALGGARTIAAAGTEARERERILRPLPGMSAEGHQLWRINARATAQAATLTPLLQLAVIATGGLLLSAGQLSVGGLLATTRYVVLATGVGMLTGHLNRLVRARSAAGRLAEVTDVPPVRYGGTAPPPGGAGRLEFRGVSVRRGGRTVLDGLDLVVPGGVTLAVVGRSGAGKSLLAALAGRLAEPDEGMVLLDGVPLADLDRRALREAVGYAFERPVLLGETLGDTIGYGLPVPDARRVAHAAELASADGFVRTLPEGYRTPCEAAPLSGGELQRLGLARAFTHTGRLLVLDDATSSLDAVTELRVGRALLSGTGSRTRLVVCHRPATAARADLVAWLDGGRIRALGPHEELWGRADYRAVWRDAGEDGEDGDG